VVGLRFRQLRRRRQQLALAAAERQLAATPANDASALLAAFERVLAARAGAIDWSPELWAVLAGTPAGAPLRALHADLDAARFGGEARSGAELLAAVQAAFAHVRE
jgi:hypothetical protein